MADQTISPDVLVAGSALPATTAAWTSATALNTTLKVDCGGFGSIIVFLNQGSTLTAGVVTFEVSDTTAFTNVYTVTGISSTDFYAQTAAGLSANTNMFFRFDVGAALSFRVRLSTVITGTGTVNVSILANPFKGPSSMVALPSPAPTLNVGQISVTTAATLIVAKNTNRRQVHLVNTGIKSVFLGGNNGVTALTGTELFFPSAVPFPITNYTGDIYGIVASGAAQKISFMEESG